MASKGQVLSCLSFKYYISKLNWVVKVRVTTMTRGERGEGEGQNGLETFCGFFFKWKRLQMSGISIMCLESWPKGPKFQNCPSDEPTVLPADGKGNHKKQGNKYLLQYLTDCAILNQLHFSTLRIEVKGGKGANYVRHWYNTLTS